MNQRFCLRSEWRLRAAGRLLTSLCCVCLAVACSAGPPPGPDAGSSPEAVIPATVLPTDRVEYAPVAGSSSGATCLPLRRVSNPPGPAKLFIYAPSEAVISIDNDRMPRNPKPFRVANLMITEPAGCQVEVSARIEKTDWTWRRSIHVLPGEHVVVKIPSRVAASPFEPLRFSATLPVPPPGQIDLLPAATMITTTTSVGEGHDDSSSAPRGETPSAPAAHDPFELPAPHPETPEVLMGGAYPGEELWLQTHKIQVNSSPGIFVPPADTLPLLMYRYQPRVPRLSINNVWPKRAEIQLRVELKVTVGNGKQILLPRIITHVNLTDDVLSGQRLLNPQIEQRVLAAIAQAISEEQGPYRLGGIVVLGQRIHELAPKPIFPMESAD